MNVPKEETLDGMSGEDLHELVSVRDHMRVEPVDSGWDGRMMHEDESQFGRRVAECRIDPLELPGSDPALDLSVPQRIEQQDARRTDV